MSISVDRIRTDLAEGRTMWEFTCPVTPKATTSTARRVVAAFKDAGADLGELTVLRCLGSVKVQRNA